MKQPISKQIGKPRKESMKEQIIITPHHPIYKEYLRENNIDKENTILVSHEHHLRGLKRGLEIILLGDWFKIKNIRDELEIYQPGFIRR